MNVSDVNTNEEVPMITITDEDADPETSKLENSVTIELVHPGPEEVAAAAEASSQSYGFEENPTLRMVHNSRLMRILLQTINELCTRVGKQAALVVAGVGSSNPCQVFGSKPLRNIIRNSVPLIIDNLKKAVAIQTSRQPEPKVTELPPLVFGGMRTPVRQLSQSELRHFIPVMLRYSLARNQPGWGKETLRPCWWPHYVPWSNVRIDTRKAAEKNKFSWTDALRQVVINCYNFHSRQDLLPAFTLEDLMFNFTVVSGFSPEIDVINMGEGIGDESVLCEAGDNATRIEYYVHVDSSNETMDDSNRIIVEKAEENKMHDAVETENIDDESTNDSDKTINLAEEIGECDLNNAVQSEYMSAESIDDFVENAFAEHMARSNSEVPTFCYDPTLPGSSQSQYQLCDSTQSEKSIEDSTTQDYVASLDAKDYVHGEMSFFDPTGYNPMEDDLTEFTTADNGRTANDINVPTFCYEDNLTLAGSCQSQYQLCDSTQSEETIEDSTTRDYVASLVAKDYVHDETSFFDPTDYNPMEDDITEFTTADNARTANDINDDAITTDDSTTDKSSDESDEGDENVNPAPSFSRAGCFFPVTAEDEDPEEIS